MKRVLPWIVPLTILLLWQVASQVGVLADQVMPAPTAVAEAFWRVTRSGELLRDIEVSTWRAFAGFAVGGGIGFALGMLNGLSGDQRETDRQHVADGAEHSSSGADPAGHPVVRHRRGSQAVPGRAGRVLPDLRQHAARRAFGGPAVAGDGPRVRHVRTGDLLARGVPRCVAVDLRRAALRPGHHVADADRGGDDFRVLRHRLHGDERARVHDGRCRRRFHPDLRRARKAGRQRRPAAGTHLPCLEPCLCGTPEP